MERFPVQFRGGLPIKGSFMRVDVAEDKTKAFIKQYLENEAEIRVRDAVDIFLSTFSNDNDFRDCLAKHSHTVKTAVFDEILRKRKDPSSVICDRCDQEVSPIHLFDLLGDKLCYRCFQIVNPLVYDFNVAVNKVLVLDKNQLKLDCAVTYEKLKNKDATLNLDKVAELLCRLSNCVNMENK